MNTPITYDKSFLTNAESTNAFNSLWSDLAWLRHGTTPRKEYYCNEIAVPYAYKAGAGMREYQPQEWHPVLSGIKARLEHACNVKFEVAFLNGYEDARDHLGWHADDSPEMDDARPIAIVTLGAEREIWFRANDNKDNVTKLLLNHGSLCLMAPGMQDTHQHRIPKCDRICGPRISITFRGYVQ